MVSGSNAFKEWNGSKERIRVRFQSYVKIYLINSFVFRSVGRYFLEVVLSLRNTPRILKYRFKHLSGIVVGCIADVATGLSFAAAAV